MRCGAAQAAGRVKQSRTRIKRIERKWLADDGNLAEGRTLRCARLSAALAAHGVAIVTDMGLSVSGQRGEWAALSVAVCVHKKKGARCAPGDANLLFADFVGFVADADEVDAATERRCVDYGAAFL